MVEGTLVDMAEINMVVEEVLSISTKMELILVVNWRVILVMENVMFNFCTDNS